MPRLLSVNSYNYVRGGSDVVYFEHANIFKKFGWSNINFSMRHPSNIPDENEDLFADRVDYGAAKNIFEQTRSASRVVYSLQAKRRIKKLIDRYPPDVAHFHIIHHHLSPSVLSEVRRRGIPSVMTAHDLKLACPNYKMLNELGICERCKGGRILNVVRHRCIKQSLLGSALIALESAVHKSLNLYEKNLDAIVAPSEFYRSKFIEWGWSEEKIFKIPNFIARQEGYHVMPAAGDYILYFGRLSEEKGISTLISASAATNIRVVIAGTGPEAAKLRILADHLSAPVDFVGFKAGAELWDLVEQARAVVIPSEWYENSPMSVLEAFSRGKIVIGAAIGGIPELVLPEVTGWLFRPGDADQLASVISKVMSLSDPHIRAMGDNAQQFVLREHSPEVYYERMIKLYNHIGLN